MASVTDIKQILSNCIDYDKILKLIIEIRQLELSNDSIIIPLGEKERVEFLHDLASETKDIIIKDTQIAMLLEAVKSIYSGPHVNLDDLKEEDLEIEEEKEVTPKKDIFEGVNFAPSDDDIEKELGADLVKTIDVDLLNQLGIDSE